MNEWLNPQALSKFFYLGQIALGILFLGILYFVFRKSAFESNFRIKEWQRHKKTHSSHSTQKEKLKLSGIRLDLPPHELLGISANPSREEIQESYRELMKRYHPDRVARPDTQAWKDAQKIAEAINSAKETLLKKIKS